VTAITILFARIYSVRCLRTRAQTQYFASSLALALALAALAPGLGRGRGRGGRASRSYARGSPLSRRFRAASLPLILSASDLIVRARSVIVSSCDVSAGVVRAHDSHSLPSASLNRASRCYYTPCPGQLLYLRKPAIPVIFGFRVASVPYTKIHWLRTFTPADNVI
jgi:hypothetical protein